MSATLALALALSMNQAPEPAATPADAARVMPPASSAAWTASDEEINRGLIQAFERSPERRVCASYTVTGTRQPREVCGTLQSWFNSRTPGEVRRRRAPYYLIEEVKERRAEARFQRQ